MRRPALIAALALTLALAGPSWAQPPNGHAQEALKLDERLAAPVHDYTLKANNVLLALLDVAGQYKIPMGIQWLRAPVALRPVRLEIEDTDVRGAIQAIADTQPGYIVEVSDGVVHVYPEELIPEGQNFLALRLDRFDVHDVAEIASRRLAEVLRPHVVPPQPTAGLVGGGTGSSLFVETNDPNISISLARPTASEALDAIVAVWPFTVWVVTFASGKNLTPTGFRRTVSPTDGEAVPDADQPTWEPLKWGQPPY
jgi:hypothetical protein